MRITNCKLNHLENPLGYQLKSTTFSWTVEQAEGKFQTAARILVAADATMQKPILDTGFAMLESLGTTLPVPLTPRTRYCWTVTVRSDADEEVTSPVHWFETAKMDEPWRGRWITCTQNSPRHPLFCYTLPVANGKPLTSARLYLCGLGLYEVQLNDEKLGNEYLTPYCNDYNSWLQYQTYDITQQLGKGGALRVLLGNGWYCGRFGLDYRRSEKPFFSSTQKLIAEIHLHYADGTEEVIGTDESWTVQRSQITSSGIYDGETVDATLPEVEPEQAILCTEDMAPLQARLSTPVTIHERLRVRTLLHTPAGETVLDIGQNQAGIFRLAVQGVPAGQTVRLQFGEVLQDGNFYRGNLGTAKQEYCWISDGRNAILQPHFTFYGYRYVKVEGIPQLRPEDFTALALYSEISPVGTLVTGNELVNRLISNTEWGQKSNFLDVPTDCPQRDERMGWTGDAQVFSATACYLTDSYAFYRKYLYDMEQEQQQRGGMVPNIVPSVGNRGCSAIWGDATCIIPWNLYLFSGDASILSEHYDSMTAWVDYITRVDGNDMSWRKKSHFGDWLALDHPAHRPDTMDGATDIGFIADTAYYYSALLTAKTASLLSKPEDAARYTRLSDHLLQRIRAEYYSPNGRCCADTQTGHLLSLEYGLTTCSEKERAALKKSLDDVGGQLRTGFVGTPLLCKVLSKNGMNTVAYDLLLNEDYPGWLYEVKLGATTIWERWNSLDENGKISSTGMNSLNHYSYGSIVEWLWSTVAGLSFCEEAPGFRKAHIEPKPDRRLREVKATYRSAAGTYEICWCTGANRRFAIEITVPFGCTAEIVLPFVPEEVLAERKFSLLSNVKDGICYVGPGHYAVAYHATRPLGKAFTPETPIGELLDSPQARACLVRFVPQAQKVHSWQRQLTLHDWLVQKGLPLPEQLVKELLMVED